jgi:hypothetical protein
MKDSLALDQNVQNHLPACTCECETRIIQTTQSVDHTRFDISFFGSGHCGILATKVGRCAKYHKGFIDIGFSYQARGPPRGRKIFCYAPLIAHKTELTLCHSLKVCMFTKVHEVHFKKSVWDFGWECTWKLEIKCGTN